MKCRCAFCSRLDDCHILGVENRVSKVQVEICPRCLNDARKAAARLGLTIYKVGKHGPLPIS